MKIDYYHIQTPDLNASFIGQLQPSLTPGFVLLCTPDGKPLFESPESYVSPSTPDEMAARVLEDERSWRQRRLREELNETRRNQLRLVLPERGANGAWFLSSAPRAANRKAPNVFNVKYFL